MLKICCPPRMLVEQVLANPTKKPLPLLEELMKTVEGRLELEDFADRVYHEGWEDK